MGTKKKLLFVFNPFSGKAQIKNQLLDIVDVMVKADYEVTIYPTQAQGDAIHKIETEAGDYDLVVCSGGDGTLDEVVTGMMHREKKVPLGYIAAGSTNDFATSLGIPKNMVKAAETAVAGRVFPCDIGAQSIGRGDLAAREPVVAEDETLQALSSSLEHMAQHLQQQMELNRQEQDKLRAMELALLQSQINPHFLYNTLDTIIWLVETGKNEQAVGKNRRQACL